MAARGICKVCNADIAMEYLSGIGGEALCFLDYEPLSAGKGGEPNGHYFFCSEHIDAARLLTEHRSHEALELLFMQYGAPPPSIRDTVEFWITSSVNADRSGAALAIRSATGFSLAKCRDALDECPKQLLVYDAELFDSEKLLMMLEALKASGVHTRTILVCS